MYIYLLSATGRQIVILISLRGNLLQSSIGMFSTDGLRTQKPLIYQSWGIGRVRKMPYRRMGSTRWLNPAATRTPQVSALPTRLTGTTLNQIKIVHTILIKQLGRSIFLDLFLFTQP